MIDPQSHSITKRCNETFLFILYMLFTSVPNHLAAFINSNIVKYYGLN